jgi:hypothetical protein
VCVVTLIVWISSAWWYVTWLRESGTTITAASGGLGFSQTRYSILGVRNPGFHSREPQRTLYLWFHWEDSPTLRGAFIPMWPLIILAGGISAFAWRLDTLARRRARLNHCPTCNYDRAGLPAASPCPECGAVPQPIPQPIRQGDAADPLQL